MARISGTLMPRVSLVTPERRVEALQRWKAGERMVDIADDYGVSRQRIQQLIAKLVPELSNHDANVERQRVAGALRRALSTERRALRAEVAMVASATTGRRCPTCWTPVIGGRRVISCGGECAGLWQRTRRVIDDESWHRHQVYVARWQLAHQDQLPGYQARYAARVVGAPADITRRPRWVTSKTMRADLKRVAELRAATATGPWACVLGEIPALPDWVSEAIA